MFNLHGVLIETNKKKKVKTEPSRSFCAAALLTVIILSQGSYRDPLNVRLVNNKSHCIVIEFKENVLEYEA